MIFKLSKAPTKIYVIIIAILWLVTTIIGVSIILGTYLNLYKNIKSDVDVAIEKFNKISDIFKETKSLTDSLHEIETKITGGNFWLNLVEKNFNIVKEFSNILLSDNTKNLISNVQNNPTLETFDAITKSFEEDITIFISTWQKKIEGFDDIGYLYTNAVDVVDDMYKGLNSLIKDIKVIFGELTLSDKLKIVIDNIKENIIPIVALKEKYKNKISLMFIKELKKKGASVTIEKNDIDDGLILVIHGCYHFEIKTTVENGFQSLINSLKEQLTVDNLKKKFLYNHDVSVSVKQDGSDGETIEICPAWGRNQRTFIILLGILIEKINIAKFIISGSLLLIVIISFIPMVITLSHATRRTLTPAGKKYYGIEVPQHADASTVLSVIIFFIGYLLAFGISIINVLFTVKKVDENINVSK
ncbi:Hypothetical protein SRAE_2000425600 [Strongyloides ratti]|uniref:Uncharacterized protein n=1 Tax=Strongyloides ratti TaxID=34506 RepID=A0A090LIP1_STRRB|nr:Hypothetical protein SRAE_2000425600 [Strongyloides ratti]CEF69608.1 Hypothetical protein SRAE_2000425600 [Strongyloides ratti]